MGGVRFNLTTPPSIEILDKQFSIPNKQIINVFFKYSPFLLEVYSGHTWTDLLLPAFSFTPHNKVIRTLCHFTAPSGVGLVPLGTQLQTPAVACFAIAGRQCQ